MAYYIFDSCTSFKLINGDSYYESTASTTIINIILQGNSFNNTNTQCFLFLPTANSVLYIGDLYDATKITLSSAVEVPVGMNYEIVAMANINGSYYYWQSSGIVAAGMTLTATLSPETRGDIIMLMKGL